MTTALIEILLMTSLNCVVKGIVGDTSATLSLADGFESNTNARSEPNSLYAVFTWLIPHRPHPITLRVTFEFDIF